jgi:hypothetical protein
MRSLLPDAEVCPKCRGTGVVFRALVGRLPARILNHLPARVEFVTCPACGGGRTR